MGGSPRTTRKRRTARSGCARHWEPCSRTASGPALGPDKLARKPRAIRLPLPGGLKFTPLAPLFGTILHVWATQWFCSSRSHRLQLAALLLWLHLLWELISRLLYLSMLPVLPQQSASQIGACIPPVGGCCRSSQILVALGVAMRGTRAVDRPSMSAKCVAVQVRGWQAPAVVWRGGTAFCIAKVALCLAQMRRHA